MEYYKHYVRINSNRVIIKAFSDAFETPLETDICINEEALRFCNIEVMDENFCYIYELIGTSISLMDEDQYFKANRDIQVNKKIEQLKYKCQSTIYSKWDEIYQRNVTEDAINNTDALAAEKAVTRDSLTRAIGAWCNDVANYINVINNKNDFDLTPLASNLNITKTKHINYLRKIVESVCIYRLKRSVREWSNEKELLINGCTNKEEIDAISFDDIPIIG